MRKVLFTLLAFLPLLSYHNADAEVWQSRYGVAETFDFKLYNADGTLDVDEADGGTEVSLSCNEGAETTATNDFVDEGTFYSIALTAAELQCERISVVVAATTTEVFFIQTIDSASAMTPTIVQTGDSFARLGAPAGASVSADVADLRADIPAALVSGRIDASVGAYQSGQAPLQPTVAARTLDVSATGEAGVDWANVGGPTTSVNLSGTTISTSQAVASVSGAVGSVTGAVGSVTGAVGSVTGNVGGNVTGSVGSVGSGGISEASFATTAGSFEPLGIVDQGTAQAATSTTLQLRSALTFADDELNGAEILITGGSAGVGQTRLITDYVSSTDTATVATWTTAPSGTITYQVRSDTATGGSVSIGVGGIAANSFAAGAIDATAISTGAIDADAVADNAIDAGAIATGAIGEAEFSSTAGTFYPLGIVDQGTAQAATSTTLQLRSAAAFANDEIIGTTCLITGGSTGVGQSRTVTDYVSSSDTATVDVWTTTPTGTVEYKCFGTAPSSGSGGSLTQADVRTAVGLASANLDTQLSGIQTDTNDIQTRLPAALVAGRVDASVGAMAANVLTAAATAVDFSTEVQSGLATAAALDAVDNFVDTEIATLLTNIGTPSNLGGGASLAANAADIEAQTDDIGAAGAGLTAVTSSVLAGQRILTGTCDSGSTTTCVDDALTQAAESQLDDRLICFDDSWCAMITGFTAGTDTVTTTKVAPSTRASKAYTIFPATQE